MQLARDADLFRLADIIILWFAIAGFEPEAPATESRRMDSRLAREGVTGAIQFQRDVPTPG
jgi:hypothetical protein